MDGKKMPDDLFCILGRIQATQEAILKSLDENKEAHEHMESRISKLEARMNYAAGAVLVGSVVFTLATKVLI